MHAVRVRLLLTIVAVLALAGAATACQPVRKDPLTVQRAVLIGDSLSHGYFTVPGIGTYLPGYFPYASFLGVGAGTEGPLDGWDEATRTTNWSRKLTEILHGGYDADIIFIQSYGKNFTTGAAWRAALDALVDAARLDDPDEHRRVVMITTPRIVPGTAGYYEASGIADQIPKNNIMMTHYPDIGLADVDAAWSVDGQPVWDVPGVGVTHYVDGFHFSDAGARDAARIASLA